MPFHIQKPDGTLVTLNDAIFAETDRVCVYTLFADDGQGIGAVHSQSVGPCGVYAFTYATTVAMAAENVSASLETGLQPMAQEMWRFPALLALIVLFVEWWFYHRQRL